MANYYDDRAELLGRYISATGATVRQTADKFRMAKSTVHKDVTVRLAIINPALAANVREVLELNLAERHLRGGEATKRKYKNTQNNQI